MSVHDHEPAGDDMPGAAEASSVIIGQALSGPPELRAALPTHMVIRSQWTDSRGVAHWFGQLERPVQHRLVEEDDPRYPTDYLGTDDHGPFLWVYYVVVRVDLENAPRPSTGDVDVELAYVLDPSLGYDDTGDTGNVQWVATVQISPYAPTTTVDSNQIWPPPEDPARAAPTGPTTPPTITADEFRRQLNDALNALDHVAGTNMGPDIPRPQEVKARNHSPGAGPTYSFDGELFRYHTLHPVVGLTWRTTTYPDEMLYWIVDDVARSVAWRWAQRAPSARTMSAAQAQSALAIPFWHNLITSLDTEWATRTRATINEMRGNRSRPRQR